MRRAALFAMAAFFAGLGGAEAGPCTKAIAKFEKVRAAQTSSDAGPSGPQSLRALEEHQPTAQSVMRAEERAQKGFEAVLARAKKLDAQGKGACREALTDAELIYFQ